LVFSDDVIVIDSFSKYHCMTGWRIGWMGVPAEITPGDAWLTTLRPASMRSSQQAAITAFDATDGDAVRHGRAPPSTDKVLGELYIT
jgi:aspartate/methionine/tyrosine aminotransferase